MLRIIALLIPSAIYAQVQLTEQQKNLRDYYNTTYRENEDGVFNPAPSAFLADTVRTLSPARALDVGMGQGRNTIFLAQQGWSVTGVDVSDEGIRQANEQARKLNLNIHTVNAAIEAFDFGKEQWDLIVFCYLDPRPYAAKVLAALRPGGVLIVEGFHKRTGKTRLMQGWFDDNELLRIFPSLRVLRYEDVLAKQDWGFQMIEPNRLVRYAAARAAPEPPGCRWEGSGYKQDQTVCWGPGRWRCDAEGWVRAGNCQN